MEVDKIARQKLGAWRWVGIRGDGEREGRMKGLGRVWGNGLGGMEEEWIREQESRYIN